MIFRKTAPVIFFAQIAMIWFCLVSPNAVLATEPDVSDADSTPESSSTATKNPDGTVFLQGNVKHSEKLSGLPEGLKSGKVYSDDLLVSPDTKNNNEWFLIPDWYAGTRHCEDEVIVYRYWYPTHQSSTPMLKQMNRQTSVSGYQKDRNGGIWDYKRVPQIQHVECDFENAVLWVKDISLISEAADRIVIKYITVSIGMNKKTNKINKIMQQEQINTVTSPLPNVLRSDVSVKAFDADGKPERLEQAVIMADMVKPYQQIDQFEGQELRPLFRDFLMSHGLEALVPLDLLPKTSR